MSPLRMLGLFILMFLHADADSDCPAEINPLTLHPPELVVQYGDPVQVNCTSEGSDHLSMEWTTNENKSYGETDEDFIVWTVNVTDWEVQAQCHIQLNDSLRCSKDLKLTIYQNPEPEDIDVYRINGSHQPEEGQEYQLQCDVNDVAPVQNLTVRWYKGKSIVKNETNSSNMSKTPESYSFILKSILSRDDDGVEFTCVAVLDLGPEIPQKPVNDSVSVQVHYKPGVVCPPHFMDVEGNFSLDTVPCRVDGNPPADVKWYHKGKVINASSTMTRNNSGEYVIVATNHLGNATATIFLSVEYPPEFEDVSSTVNVTMGGDVSLDCIAKGNPPPQFQWYQGAEGSMDLSTESNSSILTISGINSSATYNCIAANKHGNISKQINVNVIMAPTMPTPKEMTTPATKEMTAPDIHPLVLTPARVVVRYGDSVSVNCSTSSPEHDGMGWEATVGGTELMENVTYVTWTVENLTDWTIEKPVCFINIDTQQLKKELPITLYKTPDAVRISRVNGTGTMLDEGTEYQLQCKIINVAPLQNLIVRWYRRNIPITGPHAFDPGAADAHPKDAIHTISIIPSRTDHLAQYKCEAQLDLGPDGPQPPPTKTSSPLTVLVRSKPVIQGCPSHSSGVEHMFTLSTLLCRADGFPPANVHWYHGGRQIDASTPLTRMQSGTFILAAQNDMGQTNMSIDITIEYGPTFACEDHYEVEENDENSLQCKPDGKPEPQLTWFKDGQEVPHKPLTRRDSGNYTLRATNKHGTTNHTLYVDILYKPVIQDCPSNFSGVGHKFTLSMLPCIAHGNPPATVYWHHGGREINASTPLTSMQSGAFILEAQNDMGQTNMSIDITIEYPLVLMPARVVVRYGDSVSVNCSTPATEHDGMGWEASVGGTDLMENVTYVTWTVESLTQWTIDPFCYITFGSEQPMKELLVTLYKTPDDVNISQVNGTGPMLEGTEYQLQCKIINVTPLQNLIVRWYRRNIPITGLHAFDPGAADAHPKDAIHTISIIPSRTDHLAQYQCAAQLDLGPDGPQPPPTKISSPLTVSVLYKPVIQDCPSHSSGVEHTFTLSTLSCLADGNPNATVHWYHEGKQINASTPLTRMQSGTFILEAQNTRGRTSTSIDITIEYEPTFACEDHFKVEENDDLLNSIQCKPDGKPEPQLTWFKDGQEVPHKPLKRRDSGNYTLRATNKHGTANHTLFVDILYAPEFTQGNNTVDFEPGADVNLTCIAEGNPPPRVWWINADENVVLTATGEHQSTVHNIRGATSTHAGVYVCLATNEFGNVTRTTTLKMRDKPVIQDLCPSNASGVEHSFTLSMLPCLVDGNPPATVHWYHGGRQIDASTPLTRMQSGTFILEAHNNMGQTKMSIEITIAYAPEFTQGQGNKTVDFEPATDVKLTCIAEGNPLPRVRWINVDGNNAINATTGRRQSTIVNIRGATSTHAKVYVCVATNEVGNVTRTTTLKMRDKSNHLLWMIPLIIFIIIIICLMFCYHRRHRGQYDFQHIPSSAIPIPMEAIPMLPNGSNSNA